STSVRNACSSPAWARSRMACSTGSSMPSRDSVPFSPAAVSTSMTTRERNQPMTETTSPALRTALAYFQAWTSHDLDKAMEYIADDIVCDAPAGRLEGREAYLGFMRPFVQILTGSELIAAFGDDTTAVVVYDTRTVPVASAPTAECVTVSDSNITRSRFM